MQNIKEAWCVDAACSGNPGPMEYQCIHLPSRQRVFHYGPITGTNNIGEFLAVVHALALQKQQGRHITIYSDSKTALAWVRNRKAKTTLQYTPQTATALNLLERAEQWLCNNSIDVPVLKWNTEEWGEIPADFGRKSR